MQRGIIVLLFISVLVFLLNALNQDIFEQDNLKLPDEFMIKFEIYGRDNPNGNVIRGILQKRISRSGDWIIEAIANNDENIKYTYKNGRMVMSFEVDIDSTKKRFEKCVEKIQVPPSNSFRDALENAKLLQENLKIYDKEINNCPGRKWSTEYSGENYILCEGSKGIINKIIGNNVVINIIGMNTEKNLPQILINSELLEKCEENLYVKKENINHVEKWWNNPRTCNLKRIRDEKTCKMDNIELDSESNYACIFLHGVGISESEAGEPTDQWPDYWGYVHDYTPQCKVRRFIRVNTLTRGWDDIEVQKAYCNISLFDQPPGDKLIKNKIIFAHSMGNLILAGAIKNGFCDIDKKSTAWYDIMGPMYGSKAAIVLKDICLQRQTGFRSWMYKYIAEKAGYCKPNSTDPYEGYITLAPNYPGIKELGPILKERVSGFLCGQSAQGLYSKYQLALIILSIVMEYEEYNDGMVPLSSCTMNMTNQFIIDYREDNYLANINHADGTTRNGDGYWGVDRKPLSWVSLRKGKQNVNKM